VSRVDQLPRGTGQPLLLFAVDVWLQAKKGKDKRMTKALRGARLLMALVLILTVAVSLFVLPVWLVLAMGIGLAAWLPYAGRMVRPRFTWKQFWASELAEVQTTYFARSGIPGGAVLLNASSTAPTAIQASQIPVLKVRMVMVDAITQGTITHNWGLDKSSPTYLDPEIWYWCQNSTDGAPGATWLPMLTFDLTNTNVVLVNKIAGAAATPTGGTYIITLRNNAAMLNNAGSSS
jgi:hypothetical protein